MGVDYGLVRTGLAVSRGYSSMPLLILEGTNATTVAASVVRSCRSEGVARVVVGLPLHKNGTIAEQTNLTLDFCQELARQVLIEFGPRVPVLLWDERYTSKEAAARQNAPRSTLQGMLDAEAAGIIIENFYAEDGEGAERVVLPDDVAIPCLEEYEKRTKAAQLAKKQSLQEWEEQRKEREQLMIDARREAEEHRRLQAEELGDTDGKKKKKKK